MINDPIVDEIRRTRRELAARFDNDLHAICEDIRRRERESNREFRTPARSRNSDTSATTNEAVVSAENSE
jgi:hypothetical protein